MAFYQIGNYIHLDVHQQCKWPTSYFVYYTHSKTKSAIAEVINPDAANLRRSVW